MSAQRREAAAGSEPAHDPTRRTWLALERTELAWWRTGLTAIAVGVGIGRVVPGLDDSADWPFVIVGIGFALYGVALIARGSLRRQDLERMLDERRGPSGGSGTDRMLAATGAVLGFATAVLILLR